MNLDSLNIQLTATDLAKKDNTNLQDQIGLLNLKYGLQLKNENLEQLFTETTT